MNDDAFDSNAAAASAKNDDHFRSELERILNDNRFQCTDRNKNFLRFVAEEFLEGRAAAIKAYSIAVDVFGRPTSFDPSTDPIVRIEATRLRACLDRYYERFGTPGGVRIELPKGKYIPHFETADSVACGEPAIAFQPGWRGRPKRAWRPGFSSNLLPAGLKGWGTGVAVGLSCMAAVEMLGVPAFLLSSSEGISVKPIVVLNVSSPASREPAATELRDGLATVFSRFQAFRLRQDGSEAARSVPTESAPAAKANRYALEVKYYDADGEPNAWWALTDGESGEILSSGSETPGDISGPAIASLALHIATRIAGPHGVLNSIETARELDNPTLGNGCVLRSALALQTGDQEALESARVCLDRTIVRQPGNADAYAALSLVLLANDSPEAPAELSIRAAALADISVAMAPQSDRSALAQMAARFQVGNIDGAIAAGRRAIGINPDNAAAAGGLGTILIATGNRNEGVALITAAQDNDAAFYPEREIGLALDAYRSGRYRETLARLDLVREPCAFFPHVLRTAALGELHDPDASRRVARELETQHGSDMDSVRAFLVARRFAPSLAGAILSGLEKAGLRETRHTQRQKQAS